MKKQCIEDPKELDWTKFWIEKLKNKKDRGKDWNKSAETFHKKAKRDDYHDLLFSKLIISKEDSVLDLGCGEGSITIPLSKIAKNVTGIDSAEKMLELLNKRAKEQNITNINTIEESIEKISLEKLGNYDVVLASRSLNNIIPIKKVLCEINKIANKYVFISLFGPENWKVEKDFQEYLGKTPYEFPGHNYVFNILYNRGIYPNIERLKIEAYREYDSIEEAMDNGKFRLDLLDDKEKNLLKEYLNKVLTKDPKTGKLYNKQDKADWVLVWWSK